VVNRSVVDNYLKENELPPPPSPALALSLSSPLSTPIRVEDESLPKLPTKLLVSSLSLYMQALKHYPSDVHSLLQMGELLRKLEKTGREREAIRASGREGFSSFEGEIQEPNYYFRVALQVCTNSPHPLSLFLVAEVLKELGERERRDVLCEMGGDPSFGVEDFFLRALESSLSVFGEKVEKEEKEEKEEKISEKPRHRMTRIELSYLEVLESFGGASLEDVFASKKDSSSSPPHQLES